MSLFVKKSLSQLMATPEEGAGGLKRTLGAGNLVALGIGAIIGAGLFVRTAAAAGEHAGPAVTLSFVVSAVGCAFAGLCYAEFASMILIAGSAYTYSYTTMGRLWAWIIGWDLVLEYAVGAAMVAVSWSGYLNYLLSLHGMALPMKWVTGPFEGGFINLPAVVIVALMLLMRGTRESAGFNAVIVALKVAVVLTVIFLGWAYIDPVNYEPYIPANTG